MENFIGILIVITFIALIAYSGSQIRKQEEKLRVESIKHKQKGGRPPWKYGPKTFPTYGM